MPSAPEPGLFPKLVRCLKKSLGTRWKSQSDGLPSEKIFYANDGDDFDDDVDGNVFSTRFGM